MFCQNTLSISMENGKQGTIRDIFYFLPPEYTAPSLSSPI